MSEFDPELFRQDDEAETAAQQGYVLGAREAVEAAREARIGDDPEQQGPEGLLFTGDAIRELTPEQITAVGEFANRLFGVEVRPVQSVERGLGERAIDGVEEGEDEPEPVFVHYEDFIEFGVENGYTERMCRRAFAAVAETSRAGEEGLYYIRHGFPVGPQRPYTDRYPAVRVTEQGVDLRSVEARLVASRMHKEAWIDSSGSTGGGTPKFIQLMVHAVNRYVRPEGDPLSLDGYKLMSDNSYRPIR